ncbi:MAG: hypothetical protein ACTSQW_09320, partial [Promethearchaeota archaeon]
MVLKLLDLFKLSNSTPANRIVELSSEQEYEDILKEQLEIAMANIDSTTFFLNENTSKLMIGTNLPPPIIAEIVNCPEKTNQAILRKVKHYIESGADIIDIGC